MVRRVAVVGGGISGMAAAFRLLEINPAIEVHLLEAGPRLGGVLNTVHRGGYLIEEAADGFTVSPPAAIQLCQRLGLHQECIGTSPRARRALVVHRGRLHPLPLGFHIMAPSRIWPLVTTPLLSVQGKLRAGLEICVPPSRNPADESIERFVRRRFGKQVYERIVQPLIGGIYAGDPGRLSLAATFPRFREMEERYGSLLRAMWRSRSRARAGSAAGADYAAFAALRGGMGQLVATLSRRLDRAHVWLNTPVRSLLPTAGGRLELAWDGATPGSGSFDGVILALPAPHSADLVDPLDSRIAADLRETVYSSCAVVALGFHRNQLGRELDGFGFVVPQREGRMILSCSYSSVKYEGRAGADRVLMRVFIGGDIHANLLQLSSSELVQLAVHELADLLKIEGAPEVAHVARHHARMPNYTLGHLDRVANIERRLQRFPNLLLAGSGIHGGGVPKCVASGQAAAQRLARNLALDRSQDWHWRRDDSWSSNREVTI